MRNNDSKTKLNAESVLNTMDLKPLDEHELNMAKTRVWNQISHHIHINNNTMSEYTGSIKAKDQSGRRFLHPNLKLLIGGGFVAVTALFALGFATIVYLVDNTPHSNSNSQLANQTPTVTSSGLSTEEKQRLLSLASAKFKEINGVSYSDIKALAPNTPTNLDLGTGSSSNTAKNQNSLNIADIKKEDAQKIAQANEQKIYYSEVEFTNLSSVDTSLSSALASIPNPKAIQPNKPVTIKTWYSVSQAKITIYQDNKLIAAMLYGGSFSLEYRGGQYAIKNVYTDEVYLSGISKGSMVNPELSLIQSILDASSQFKKIGDQKIEGVNYTIFESSYDAKAMSSVSSSNMIKERYYINLDQFRLYKIETFSNEKLVQTAIIKESKDINAGSKDSIAQYINSDEIKTIPVKEHKVQVAQMPDYKLVDFIQKYPVFSIIDPIQDPIYIIPNQEMINDEYEKLINNKEFDPYYTANTLDSRIPIGSYYQNNIGVEIYAQEPQEFKIDAAEVNTTSIDFQIDGVKTTGKYIERTYKTDNTTKDFSLFVNVSIVFRDSSGNWYRITENAADAGVPIKYLKKGNLLNITKITADRAKQIDDARQIKNSSMPEIKAITLKELNEPNPLLPGDLSKEYRLTLGNVFYSPRKGQDSQCEKYYMVAMGDSCLIEKYNGYGLSFDEIYCSKEITQNCIDPSVSRSKFRNLSVIVLNTTTENVKVLLNNFANEATNFNMKLEDYAMVREISGKTVVLKGNLDASSKQKIFSQISIKNGYDELVKQSEDSKASILPADQPVTTKQ